MSNLTAGARSAPLLLPPSPGSPPGDQPAVRLRTAEDYLSGARYSFASVSSSGSSVTVFDDPSRAAGKDPPRCFDADALLLLLRQVGDEQLSAVRVSCT